MWACDVGKAGDPCRHEILELEIMKTQQIVRSSTVESGVLQQLGTYDSEHVCGK